MNEEMMTMEAMENEETRELDLYEEYPETKGSAGKIAVGLVVAAGAAIAGGVAVWAHKTKDKREQKQIAKLEKKGYVIYKEEELVEAEVSEDVPEEETEE